MTEEIDVASKVILEASNYYKSTNCFTYVVTFVESVIQSITVYFLDAVVWADWLN